MSDEIVFFDPPRLPSAEADAPAVERSIARLAASGVNGWEGLRECYTPDFEFESRRTSFPRRGGIEDWLPLMKTSTEFFPEGDMRLVARRGDRLALVKATSRDPASGFEHTMLAINETTPDALTHRVTFFDNHQYDEAVQLLESYDVSDVT